MSNKSKVVDLQIVVCMAVCCILYSAGVYLITPDKEAAWVLVDFTMLAFLIALMIMLFADYKSDIKQLWSQDHERTGNAKPRADNRNSGNKTSRRAGI